MSNVKMSSSLISSTCSQTLIFVAFLHEINI